MRMNPYVEIEVGKVKKKTNTHSGGHRTPNWEKEDGLKFDISNERDMTLYLFHGNMLMAPTEVGRGHFPLFLAPGSNTQDVTLRHLAEDVGVVK